MNSVYRHSKEVAYRRIVDEIVLVPIRKDAQKSLGVYRLNKTAAVLWEMMDGTRTVDDLVDAMVARFEVEPDLARTDIKALINDLRKFRAIEEDGDQD